MHLATFFQWLNDLPFSVALREDDWPFPIIETFHILGLGLSVGVIVWIDLRLIGVTFRLAESPQHKDKYLWFLSLYEAVKNNHESIPADVLSGFHHE